MKVLIGVVSMFFVVLIFGMVLSDGGSAPTTAQVAAAAVEDVEAAIDTPSDTEQILELTTEGEVLSNEVAELGREGVEAARAMDVGRVCDLLDEINPKVDRLSEIVYALERFEQVPRSTIVKLRGFETDMRAGFAEAGEIC